MSAQVAWSISANRSVTAGDSQLGDLGMIHRQTVDALERSHEAG
jgi:hypothetical protein